jgi:hypothetical protein
VNVHFSYLGDCVELYGSNDNTQNAGIMAPPLVRDARGYESQFAPITWDTSS